VRPYSVLHPSYHIATDKRSDLMPKFGDQRPPRLLGGLIGKHRRIFLALRSATITLARP
jgi:hypothetical protein